VSEPSDQLESSSEQLDSSSEIASSQRLVPAHESDVLESSGEEPFVLQPYDLPLELPPIPGVSIVGQELRSSTGIVYSGWLRGGGQVRITASRWPLEPEWRGQLPELLNRLQAPELEALPFVPLHDTHADPPWFVLRDPRGLPLTRVLARHGIPRFQWSSSVIYQFAKKVAQLHELGILHLDIRPETVHVDAKTGTACFSTLGLFQPRAELLREMMRADQATALGAASALAPELLSPETLGPASERTDVYAIGATLYTLLSGSTPFSGGTTATILRKVASEDPTPLGRINADVPEVLEALCVACLKKNPADRPKDARVIAEALEATAKVPPGPVSLTRLIQVIGDYRVVRILQRRGATVIYEVISKRHESSLALELGPLHGVEAESSLQRERELIQCLEKHPNILKIHEVGLHEGRRYTVSSLVDGRTLEDLLAEGPLPLRRAMAIGRDIAHALVFCHNYGVVHRGTRPDLVLVDDATGRALLTSVGRGPEVVDEGRGPTALVSRGLLFSTLFYFSPEQVDDSIGTIDGQTDVYVLGVMIYEMLTGMRPYGGDTPRAVLGEILTGEPPSPESLNPAVDQSAAAVCLRALAVEKERRYRSATELREDLQRWLDGQPVEARQRSFFGSLTRRITRRVWVSARRMLGLVGRSYDRLRSREA